MRAYAVGLLLVFAAFTPAFAQSDLQVKPELRADLTRIGNRYDIEAGGGVEIPMGYYTRIGVLGMAGADVGRATQQNAIGRIDVLARFLFDPFRQQRWGLSAGGGVSLRARARDHMRPYLLSLIDLEGPRGARGISPALQLGLGGGIRLGAVLRWSGTGSR